MSAMIPQIGISIAVQNEDTGAFLLVKRGRAPAKGMWAFPGGRLEFGETMIDGVSRELKEETGLEARQIQFFDHVEIIEIEANDDVAAHHFLLCVHKGLGNGQPVAADDAGEARWISLEEMHTLPVTDSTFSFAQRIALSQS